MSLGKKPGNHWISSLFLDGTWVLRTHEQYSCVLYIGLAEDMVPSVHILVHSARRISFCFISPIKDFGGRTHN